jgi:hypothetical protein
MAPRALLTCVVPLSCSCRGSVHTCLSDELLTQHSSVDALFGQDKLLGIDDDAGSNCEDSDYTDNYQLALDLLEDADDDLTPTQEQRLKDYRYASIALSMEEHAKM